MHSGSKINKGHALHSLAKGIKCLSLICFALCCNIPAVLAANIEAVLDSNNGSSAFVVEDSGTVTMASIDSDGKAWFSNVGIGTTVPRALLDVKGIATINQLGIGTTTATSLLNFPAGTTVASGILFGSDVNLYRSQANRLRTDDELDADGGIYSTSGTFTGTVTAGSFSGNGANLTNISTTAVNPAGNNNDVQYKNASGTLAGSDAFVFNGTNVGIGTLGPRTMLEVDGTIYAANIGIGSTSPAAALDIPAGTVRLNGMSMSSDSGNLKFDNWNSIWVADVRGTNYDLAKVDSTSVLRVDTTNSRIGIGTTVPAARVDVGGGTATYIDGVDDLLVKGDIEADGNIYGVSGTFTGTITANAFSGDGSGLTGVASAGGWTDGTNVVYTTAGADNVGIGTTTPAKRLDIVVSSNTDGLRISGGGIANIGLTMKNTGTGGLPFSFSSTGSGHTLGNGKLVLFPNELFNGTPIITFDGNNGNVGVGTTAPGAKLEVLGSGATSATTAFAVRDSASAAKFMVLDDGSVGIGTAPTSFFTVYHPTDPRIEIRSDAGYMYISKFSGPWSGTTNPFIFQANGGDLVYTTALNDPTKGFVVKDGGNVGFGYADPGTAKVAVNGNLGIGTTAPAARVDVGGGTRTYIDGVDDLLVKGDIEADGDIYGAAGNFTGTVTANAFVGNGSSLTGLPAGGAAGTTTQIQYNDAGSMAGAAGLVYDKATGNVGIGTTAPGSALEVAGGTAFIPLRITGTNTGAQWSGRIIAGGPSNVFLMGQYNDHAWLGAHNSALNAWADFYINPDGAQKVLIGALGGAENTILTVDNATGDSYFMNGNVGIGTTAPGAGLHLYKDVDDPTSAEIRVENANNGTSVQSRQRFLTNDSTAALVLTNKSTAHFAGTQGFWVSTEAQGGGYVPALGFAQTSNVRLYIPDSDNPNYGDIQLGGAAAATAPMVVIKNGGNVGIGVTNPTSLLDVAGQLRVNTRASGEQDALYFKAGPGGSGSTMSIAGDTTGTDLGQNIGGRISFVDDGAYGAHLVFENRTGSQGMTTTEKMRITTEGNVGIGSAAPIQKLDVAGTVRATLFSGDGSGLTGLAAAGGWTDGTNVVYTTVSADNVGIGTSVPVARLDLVGTGTTSATAALMIRNSDKTAKVAVLDNGNVGIGTTVPAKALAVVGGGSFSSDVSIGGVGNSAGLVIGENANIHPANGNITIDSWGGGYGVYLKGGTGVFVQSPSGTERMRVDNAGNVGIGSAAPTQRVDIKGGDMTLGTAATANGSASEDLFVKGNISADGIIYGNGAGITGIASGGGWTDGGANIYTATAADNVGIGTSVPAARLDLVGTGTTSATTAVVIRDSNLAAKVTVLDNGNVGIGTTIPAAALMVSGTVRANAFTLPSEGAADAKVSYMANQNENITFGNGSLTFNTHGASVPFVFNTGNIGIGSSSPAAKLELVGTGTTSATSSLVVRDANKAEKVTILDNGNVGVGTAAPSSLLHLRKDQAAYTELRVHNSNNTSTASAGLSLYGGQDFPTANFISYSTNAAAPDTNRAVLSATSNIIGLNIKAESAAGTINFYTGGAASERMRIDKNGNVGIGTSTPRGMLEVDGNLYVMASGNLGIGTESPSAALHVFGSMGAGFNGNDLTGIRLTNSPNGVTWRIASGIGGVLNAGFSIDDVTQAVSRLVINASGNVGIGSIAPAQRLDVVGTVKATAFSGDGSGLTGIGAAGGWTDGGTSIYPTTITDNVGIGSVSPVAKLNVAGDIVLNNGGTLGFNGSNGIGFRNYSGNVTDLHGFTSANMRLYIDTNANESASFSIFGDVPEGTTAGALFALGDTGNLTLKSGMDIRPSANATSALNIAQADGTKFTSFDTTNSRVGIGTTAPAARLHLYGGGSLNPNNLLIQNTQGDYAGFQYSVSGGAGNYIGDGNAIFQDNRPDTTGTVSPFVIVERLGALTKGNLFKVTGGTTDAALSVVQSSSGPAATITGGNVGIGSLTPGARLELVGTGTTSATSTLVIRDSNLAAKVTVLDNGNIGIGTASPLTLLHVNEGRLRMTSASGSATAKYGELYFDGTNFVLSQANSSGNSGVQITTGDGSAIWRSSMYGGATYNGWQLDPGSKDLAINSTKGILLSSYGAVGNNLSLAANGNVGIGTTVPAAKLDLVGAGTTSATSALIIRDSIKAARVTVLDNGNVGIGSAAPQQALDVVGTVKATAFSGNGSGLSNVAGTVSALTAGKMPYAQNANTLIDSSIYTNGTNVGIGTTVPTARLDVVSDNSVVTAFHATATASVGGAIPFMMSADSTSTGPLIARIGHNANSANFSINSWLDIESDMNNGFMVLDGGDGAAGLEILPNGANLLVGSTSDNSLAKLQVTGNAMVSDRLIVGENPASTPDISIYRTDRAGQAVYFAVENGDNTDGASNGRFDVRVGGADGGDPYVNLDISNVGGWSMGIDNSDNDTFKIDRGAPPSPGVDTKLAIQTNGNIGIGIATPGSLLHVSKGSSGAAVDVNAQFAVENAGHAFIDILSDANSYAGFYFGNPADSHAGELSFDAVANQMFFKVHGGDASVTIDGATKFVGIGPVTPGAAFDVYNKATIDSNGRANFAGGTSIINNDQGASYKLLAAGGTASSRLTNRADSGGITEITHNISAADDSTLEDNTQAGYKFTMALGSYGVQLFRPDWAGGWSWIQQFSSDGSFSLGNDGVAHNGTGGGILTYTAGGSVAVATPLDVNGRANFVDNVGIGTTVPAARLDIGGGTATNIDGADDLLVKGDIEADGNIYGTAGTFTGTVTANVFSGSGAGLTNLPGAVLGLAPGYVPRAQTADTLVDSVIYSDGTNVGIGSTVPQARLQVASGQAYTANAEIARFSYDTTNNRYVRIKQTGTSSILESVSSSLTVGTNGADTLSLQTQGTTKMTILSGGSVGIGTIVPNSKLQVAGSFAVDRTSTAVNASSAAETIIGVTNTGSARTITLSDTDKVAGRIVIVKDESGGAATNNITVQAQTGTIDGAASVVITANYGVVRVYSDGTNWFTF